jgi:hypothetical protein
MYFGFEWKLSGLETDRQNEHIFYPTHLFVSDMNTASLLCLVMTGKHGECHRICQSNSIQFVQ